MKKLVTTILGLSISTALFCQSNEMIAPFFENGKWGFINQHKEIIIEPTYEEAYPSISDRLRIKTNGKYGYVDHSGTMVIKAKYESAKDFKHGIAKVNHRGKEIYINSEGKINKQSLALCGTHYHCHTPRLSKNIEIIQEEDKFGIIHDRIKRDSSIATYVPDTIPAIFDSIFPITHQLMGLVKDSMISFSHEGSYLGGKEYVLKNLNFIYQDIKQFQCNLCGEGKNEYIGIKQNNLWGYMRIYLEPIAHIHPKYHSISSLAEGFALVEYELGKFGYIDSKGNEYFIR